MASEWQPRFWPIVSVSGSKAICRSAYYRLRGTKSFIVPASLTAGGEITELQKAKSLVPTTNEAKAE